MKTERAFIVIEVHGGVASVRRVPARGVEVVIVDHDNRVTYRNIDGHNYPSAKTFNKNPKPTRTI